VQAGWYSSFDEPIRLLENGGSLPLPDFVDVDVWWGRLEKRSWCSERSLAMPRAP